MSEKKQSEKKQILGLLYSGGYDSVALLDVILKDKDTTNLIVLFEEGPSLQNEAEIFKAKAAFRYLVKKYSRKELNVKWISEKINLSWFLDKKHGGDALLSTHLMSILRHGEVDIWYTGWHKHNLDDLPLANKILEFFEKYKEDGREIFFMEDFFHADSEFKCKCSTISYLLQNNIFHLPYTGILTETIEEYRNRDCWYTNDMKCNEVASALVTISEFKDGFILSDVMQAKSTKDIQRLYNKLVKVQQKESKEK